MKHSVWLALCLIAVGLGVGALLRPENSGDALAGAPDRDAAATVFGRETLPRRSPTAEDGADSALRSDDGAPPRDVRLASTIDPVAPSRPARVKRIEDPDLVDADPLDADVVEIGAFLSADIMGGLSYGIETDEPRDIGISLDADRPWSPGALRALDDGPDTSIGRPPAFPRSLAD